MSKQPTHLVYHVRDNGDASKGFWTRVGAAWQHQDGKGFNVKLDVVPLDGRLALREASEKEQPAS